MPAPNGTAPATHDEEMAMPLIENKHINSMINGGSDASGLLEEDEERKRQWPDISISINLITKSCYLFELFYLVLIHFNIIHL